MPNKWRIVKEAVRQSGWKKLLNPSVKLHLTAFPKNAKDLEKLGVQVNAGDKIPKSWKVWREKHSKGKGTHGIVATIKVPDSGTREDVAQAFDDVEDQIE